MSAVGALSGGLRLPLSLGAAALAVYALAGADAYGLRLLTVAGTYGLMVIGYQIIFGHAGALSLAQGAFFGIGAYVTGILGSRYGLSFVVTFPLSLAVPALLAALVAVPVLRLESHYFALATLGLAQLALVAGINWESVTGGANGLPGVPPIRIAGLAIERGLPLTLFVWTMVGVGGWIAWRWLSGLTGLAYTLLRDAPLSAAAAGIDGGRLRFAAFVASAAYGGAAGALYVHAIGVISPEVLEFPIMVAVLSMAVIGGRIRVAGAVAAALLLVHLPESFRFLEAHYLIAYGLAVLAVITLAPNGLIGTAEKLRARLWPEPPPLLPVGAPLAPVARKAPPESTLLEVSGLRKSFGGVHAVADVSLAVAAGEIVGLMGPNGSGKTTLVNLIAGNTGPDGGQVRLHGRDVTGQSAFRMARAGIGRSFQNPLLADDLCLVDMVAAAAGGGSETDLEAARSRALALLERMHIAAAAHRPCAALAHGLRRRADIARALMHDPDLLILDEPAAGLTGAEQQALSDSLRELASQGRGLLVIEHNMGFLLGLADRIVCLDQGHVIAAGAPADIRADPGVIAAYLGTATRP